MSRWGRSIIFGFAILAPLGAGGQAFAAPNPDTPRSIVQELHVTATVPDHRDIIVGLSGRIIRITSNTAEDVIPSVYSLEVSDAGRRPLSGALYAEYRRLVPEGTAKRGVLYSGVQKSTAVKDLLSVAPPAKTIQVAVK